MSKIFNKKLEVLQKSPENIRNICILAHVDHGKTSLADSLVAANGVISPRLAGKLRYMDSRKDEQERGITMKSSSISLYYPCMGKEYLINLMDSPGHVDFSSEVCTAVRLCDGAIIVVDIVEGVQPQTKVVLQQAWDQGIRPVLVLNKIDRLFVEKKMDTTSAYLHISQVLEQVNAVMGELFATSVMSQNEDRAELALGREVDEVIEFTQGEVYNWSSGLEDADDSQLYFSPEEGNVVFASAVDGWAFSLHAFASIYCEKLGFNKKVLMKTLWGDFFVNMKDKKIKKGAQSKGKKNLFIQLVLDPIWAVYETVLVAKDKDRLEKIIISLGLKVSPRDMRTTDLKQQLLAVMSSWLPIAIAVLSMVCEKIPSPASLTEERGKKLMCNRARKFEAMPVETQALLKDFLACSNETHSPKITFISKMFPVSYDQMPENRPKPLTEEEMIRRRAAAREKLTERKLDAGTEGAVELTTDQLKSLEIRNSEREIEKEKENQTKEDENSIEFVAFARVFSGSLQADDELFVLGPKYDPCSSGYQLMSGEIPPGSHVSRVTIKGVYMLLGRDLEQLDVGLPGNIVGISGLADKVIKSATLSSSPWCPPFVELVQTAVPILRVALEPVKSSDISALNKGLQILNQADAHVEVIVSEVGENLLLTAGEVHLQRCILDLTETYAKCDITMSDPIVPFRETIVRNPETDMVNELIEGDNKLKKCRGENPSQEEECVDLETPNKQCHFRVRAVPLPSTIIAVLESNQEAIRAVTVDNASGISSTVLDSIESMKEKLTTLFDAVRSENDQMAAFPTSCTNKILSFGPKRCGSNILVNNMALDLGCVWRSWRDNKTEKEPRHDFVSSVVNGFQLASLAGPICEEPMMGVAFILDEWTMRNEYEDGWGPLSGQIVSTFKECCRQAFSVRPQRLMVAMYTCDINVKAEVLGRLYSVISKRRGQVVKEEMIEGSSTFTVTAHIPVIESINLSHELRKQTSGLAMPQLVFSHWEVLDIDPYWEPQTEEELAHFGEKADSENPAKVYMNKIKRRKGLKVDDKIVEFAEKQRTLTKSK